MVLNFVNTEEWNLRVRFAGEVKFVNIVDVAMYVGSVKEKVFVSIKDNDIFVRNVRVQEYAVMEILEPTVESAEVF
jgi:hypothetical protein